MSIFYQKHSRPKLSPVLWAFSEYCWFFPLLCYHTRLRKILTGPELCRTVFSKGMVCHRVLSRLTFASWLSVSTEVVQLLAKEGKAIHLWGLHFLSFLPPSFSMCAISPPLIHGCLLLPWWAVVDWVQAPWLWPGFQSNLVLVSSLWGKYLAASSKKWEWQREPILHGWPRLEKTLLPQNPNWIWG